MRFETIADIYAANAIALEKLVALLSGVSPDEATKLPDGEKWTVQQIVEHVAIADGATARICSKLVDQARNDGKPSDGKISISLDFGERSAVIAGLKVEAPERVQPTGDVTIAESLDRINSTRQLFESMQTDLENFDLSGSKFPHPFLGDLTAAEWLIVAGGHTARHAKQIKRLLAAIRQ